MRALVVDDHAVVRRGLIEIMMEAFPSAVFGEAESAPATLRQLREHDWDVLLLDITMPGRSGLDVLKELKASSPHTPALVLSMHPEDQYAVRALKAGAAGYLTKESAPDELVRAIRKVLSGGKYVSDSLAERLAFDLQEDARERPHEKLSDREHEVMRLIASGKTVTQIAKELSLSVKTISTYRSRILEKMRMKTNAEIVYYAIEHGLIE